MSDVAYHVTKHVRHLSVYTRDEGSLWSGLYRPICGATTKGRLEFTNVFPSEAAYEYAMRRPICKRCAQVAAALAAEAGALGAGRGEG